MRAIDKILQNLYLPQSEEEWRLVAIEWEWKLKKKFQMYDTCLMKGTTLAVDGIVIETTQPLLSVEVIFIEI